MIVVLAELGEPHGRKLLLIESIMISGPQVPSEPKNQHGFYASIIRAADFRDVACQFARGRIAFSAQHANHPNLLFGGRDREACGEHPYHAGILLRILVPAYDVVV